MSLKPIDRANHVQLLDASPGFRDSELRKEEESQWQNIGTNRGNVIYTRASASHESATSRT
jgi:hypothetical protein